MKKSLTGISILLALFVAFMAGCNGDDPPPDTPPGHEDWVIIETDTIDEMLTDIHFDSQGNGWAIGEQGMYVTTVDGGNTWQVHDPLASVNLNKLWHNGANKMWIVGDEGTILYSTNNGVNWTTQNCPTEGNLNSIFFVNNNSGWIVGSYAEDPSIILHTNNGGTGSNGWNFQEPPENLVILNDVFFANETKGCVVGEYGTIYMTDNAGLEWERANDLTTKHIYSVYFISDEAGFAVGQDGVFLNYGKDNITEEYRWYLTSEDPYWDKFSVFDLYTITFANATEGWSGGKHSGIYVTTDGAVNWTGQYIKDVVEIRNIFMDVNLSGWAVGKEWFSDQGVILKYNPE